MARSTTKGQERIRYGDARQALLDAVGAQLAIRGPRAVVLADICEELNLSPALVNYHFGGRDRLLAEAVVHEHAKLVEGMNAVTFAVTSSAEDQFRARFRYRFDWTTAHPGIDSMLNYTHVLDPVGEILTQEFEARVSQITISDMGGLSATVAALYHGHPINHELTADDPLYRPEFADLTAFVALSALGAATFLTGKHPGSASLSAQYPALLASLRDDFTTRVIAHLHFEFTQLL
jgi:AcrR family transcriptional regulator